MQDNYKNHEELMLDWKNRIESEGIHFNPDGIVNKTMWNKSSKKILFILKETNGAEQDLTEAIQRSSEQKTGWHKGKVLRRVGRWAYGLEHFNGDIPSFEEAKSYQFKAPVNTAYINLKKSSGGARTNEKLFHSHVEKYADLIKQQIELINPDIIVMGGTYKYLKKYVFPDEQMVKVSERVHTVNNTRIAINAWHPAAIKKAQVMYVQVLGSYEKYYSK